MSARDWRNVATSTAKRKKPSRSPLLRQAKRAKELASVRTRKTSVQQSPLAEPADSIPLELTVQYVFRKGWLPSRILLGLWIYAALGRRRASSLVVRVVGNTESRTLNRSFREKDKPTNVLSFIYPAQDSEHAEFDGDYLGDLVICAPVVAREAQEQGKTVEAHWAHMVVHGTLHLLGYDHENPADARRMERREIAILRCLGFDNPYLLTAT
jgi:probable rRNA maturation factor